MRDDNDQATDVLVPPNVTPDGLEFALRSYLTADERKALLDSAEPVLGALQAC